MTVDFGQGFKEPEMVKKRLCIVISPPLRNRHGLCTVVPLSTTRPQVVEAYHHGLDIAFELPAYWGNVPRWVKADMICAVGFHRVDLLRLGKDRNGKRIYQTARLPPADLSAIGICILKALAINL